MTSRRHPSTYSSADVVTLLQAQRAQAKRRLRVLHQKANELAKEIESMERQLADIDSAENAL